ncbi:MerR family transcriptional regulator [Streptococcus chenjunshii]|nr:helix-turn-helix domain-containing protein [Streptococcus chenjunshii]
MPFETQGGGGTVRTLLRIGEFSRINRISIQTLRFYDQIDLLTPFYVDPMTKYRYYHINQSPLVDAIQHLQQLNFSLKEIKLILSREDFSMLNQLIENHRQELQEKELMLHRQQYALDEFQASLRVYENHLPHKGLDIVKLPERRILSYPVTDNIYQMSAEEYEMQLRLFKKKLQPHTALFQHFGRVGSIMSKQHFLAGYWYSKKMFVLAQEKLDFPFTEADYLPRSLYAVTYCDSFQEELAVLPAFLKAVQETDYHICGDYICQVIYEHPKLKDTQRKMFIRMQVPIAHKRDLQFYE